MILGKHDSSVQICFHMIPSKIIFWNLTLIPHPPPWDWRFGKVTFLEEPPPWGDGWLAGMKFLCRSGYFTQFLVKNIFVNLSPLHLRNGWELVKMRFCTDLNLLFNSQKKRFGGKLAAHPTTRMMRDDGLANMTLDSSGYLEQFLAKTFCSKLPVGVTKHRFSIYCLTSDVISSKNILINWPPFIPY